MTSDTLDVRYPRPLVEGIFRRRYKRFFADVELEDGTVVVAHCPNTGSMRGVGIPGSRCRILAADDPKRKLRWTLEQLCVEGHWVMVHTGRPNRVVEEAIRAGRIPELTGYDVIQREKPYGTQNSRIDLRLLQGGELPPGAEPKVRRGKPIPIATAGAWVEVKNVTLVEGGVARFPDAVTTRGAKHLDELIGVVQRGQRGVLFFHVGRGDPTVVEPADDLDPAYGEALRRAVDAGVEVIARCCDVGPEGLAIGRPVELRLPTRTA